MRYENAFSDQDRIAFLEREPNLSCFYWHRAFGVEKDGEKIAAVKALDVMANRVVRFRAPRFCDATGDGWVGFWAGADWRDGASAVRTWGSGARAIYPLPVKKAGRYRLKGLVPHLFNYSFAPVVRLTVKSGERSTELVWNQLAGSGEWQDLAVVDLVPGATLMVSEGPIQDPVYGSPWVGAYAADGFAIVQEEGE